VVVVTVEVEVGATVVVVVVVVLVVAAAGVDEGTVVVTGRVVVVTGTVVVVTGTVVVVTGTVVVVVVVVVVTTGNGVTVAEFAGGDVPTAFTASTVKVYSSPGVKSITVSELAVGSA
jgi:hypothetical protein